MSSPFAEKAISGAFLCPFNAICFSITSAPDATAVAATKLFVEWSENPI